MKLTEKQISLIEVARKLGREKFLPRAASYDKNAKFPHANYVDLRKAGFLSLAIPKEYGGMGADFPTYALVAAEIGRWCGATALTFNMHTATMMWTSLMADDISQSAIERKAHELRRHKIYRLVIENGAIFGQPFSEPKSSAAAGRAPFGTLAKKVDGGWIVNGQKHFASLAGAANYYGILCTEDKEGEDANVEDTIYLAVSENSDGFSIYGDWDVLGMRGTVSKNLQLKNVFVPDDFQLLPRGVYYQAALNWPHMFMTLCPTYMGISEAAFDFTCKYLRGEIANIEPSVAARNSPSKQLTVAEMRVKLEQARALFRQAISEAGANPSKEERLRAYATQYTVMEYANDICRLAIRACGGRSIFKSLRLEQLYRDSRCGSLMLPWTADICMERLGRESLFEPGENYSGG